MQATPSQPGAALAARGSAMRALRRSLRACAAAILLLLLTQFVVGMVANLYVEIPAVHPGTQGATPFSEDLRQTREGLGWALAHGALTLRVHVVLGILLGVAALVLIGLAIAARSRAWIIAAVIGFLSIAGAGANGVAFVNAGSQAINSLAMAVDFLLALVAYAVGFYITRPMPPDG